MSKLPIYPIRRSILDIQNDYDNGNPAELENLMTAWAGIKALDAADLNSFFILGGYHGEPFRGAGYSNSQWWGGWCNHGNVLFPTWHRMYLVRLEKALQSIPGCENVMLPFWDETDAYSLANGIPSCLTDDFFSYKSQELTIPNPLRSYTFPVTITDNVSSDQEASDGGLYSKPAGYTSVRYPYSGLVGSATDQAQTAAHNAQWPTAADGNAVLNTNVVNWLTQEYVIIAPDGTNPGGKITAGILAAFQACLDAPNYTVFSNTTSAGACNNLLPPGTTPVIPLESPHNDIHLAVGGYDVTEVQAQDGDESPIVGANGDMGENDTAGLDPIFFFHHCNIDRMFWVWQKKNGFTDALDIIPEYPGTNSVDNQGPTAGVSGNVWLGMDSPLMPFKDANGNPYISYDVVNIETQLGYTYAIGSLDQESWPPPVSDSRQLMELSASNSGKTLVVSGANKASVAGSFIIAAHAYVNGKKHLVGMHSVLSRHAIQGCANCQTHLNVTAHFSLNHLTPALVSDPNTIFTAEIIGHKKSRAGLNASRGVSAEMPNKQLRTSIK